MLCGVGGGFVLLGVVAAAIVSIALALRKKTTHKDSPNCSDDEIKKVLDA